MKKLVLSLLVTAICSTITAQDEKQFKGVQYNSETGTFAWAKKIAGEQAAWNRETENDYHIQIQTPYIRTPWFDIKKVDVNVSQIAHIIGIVLSLKLMDFTSEKGQASKETVVLPYNLNRYNVSALLFCTYRFIAGQQKNPFKIVNQEEATA